MALFVKIASYLFERLQQLGVGSVFGVPGDYNLKLLDVLESSDLRWVGNCNELNAAYAADGYARINGLGVVITTFGVGELSAVNGIAGAFAEKAPVVHIVGTPSRELQESRIPMHHTFADGDYRRFAAIHTHITIAQANLTDPRTALQRIDWILHEALLHSRPVYLEIPEDMVDNLVPRLGQLPVPPSSTYPSTCAVEALDFILKRMYSALRPLVLVDGEIRPCGIMNQVDQLVQKTEWPTWTTTSGKGMVNEQLQNVYGVYVGGHGSEQSKAYFEAADTIIHLGPHVSDTNSQGFSTLPKEAVTVSISNTFIQVGSRKFRDLCCKVLLEQILENLDTSLLTKVDRPPRADLSVEKICLSDPVQQRQFYPFVNPLFRSGDVVLTETGTAAHGGRAFQFPPNVRMLTAVTWLSIGYMLPAALGAALSRQDSKTDDARQTMASSESRVILFVGDGSLQMSVQELSTMIRERINAIIFVINNDGYTIERAINGKDQSYNDIASWRHREALSFFGDNEDHAKKSSFTAATWAHLRSAIDQVREGSGVRLIEVLMGRLDCQGALLDSLKKQVTSKDIT